MINSAEQIALERQRTVQQGLGRPIFSWLKNGVRYVAVGGKICSSWRWGTFHDFLMDYVVNEIGVDWLAGELKKSSRDMHPLAQWYRGLCDHNRTLSFDGVEVVTTDSTGLIAAYLCFAYNLYIVSHNVELAKIMIKRLKNKDQFHGAYYELFVAAQFIKSGFSINYEDECDITSSHVEFVSVHEKSGKSYSVEAKARHVSGALGARSGQGENLSNNVKKQLKKALSKNAEHARIVFIDANFRDKVGDPDCLGTLKKISYALREDEDSIVINGKPAPQAYVFITNYPYHYELEGLDYRCSVIQVGFKIPDFNIDSKFYSLGEALHSRDNHQDMLDLMDCMKNQEVPSTFDGEIPEFAFGENDRPRLLLGGRYIIPEADGNEVIGELVSACVIENEQQAHGVYKLDDGRQIVACCPLSDLEMRAYKRHPDTFFGVVSQVGGTVRDGIDLFDFLYNTYKASDRSKLLEFMSTWPDIETLRSLPQEELARIFCLRLAEAESRKLV